VDGSRQFEMVIFQENSLSSRRPGLRYIKMRCLILGLGMKSVPRVFRAQQEMYRGEPVDHPGLSPRYTLRALGERPLLFVTGSLRHHSLRQAYFGIAQYEQYEQYEQHKSSVAGIKRLYRRLVQSLLNLYVYILKCGF